jgi:NADH dehydrogenase
MLKYIDIIRHCSQLIEIMHKKPASHKKNIVILGAGYCGISAAKELAARIKNLPEYQIILIDKKAAHTFSADLYEIGTAFYPHMTESCKHELKDTASIPLREALKWLDITFLQAAIEKIDHSHQKITLSNGTVVPYEYVIVALGSVTNFYNLPGVEQHGFPLKTADHAIALNCRLEELFRRCVREKGKTLKIVVGGGGFTGVEYACELPGFVRKLQFKYRCKNKVEITVIQSGHELVGLGQKVSDITMRRFRKLGIKALLHSRIYSYDGHHLTIADEKGKHQRMVPADLLIWTAGIKPNPLLRSFEKLSPSGAMEVLPTLESTHYSKVYAGGDNADIYDSATQHFLPKLGQLALQEGKAIADNIWADIVGKPQRPYRPAFKGFIVALGGKYFVYNKGRITFAGLLPGLLRRLFIFWYFARLMPLQKTFKKWWHTGEIYARND